MRGGRRPEARFQFGNTRFQALRASRAFLHSTAACVSNSSRGDEIKARETALQDSPDVLLDVLGGTRFDRLADPCAPILPVALALNGCMDSPPRADADYQREPS